MVEKILILDFGSQVTQLIGRRLRELNVYCEIHPFNKIPQIDDTVKGVILSGSPCSVTSPDAPQVDLRGIKGRLPLLGICYGAQYLAHHYGGAVASAGSREYGRAELEVKQRDPLFDGVPPKSQVWMSHGDTITRLPDNSTVLASTVSVTNAAYRIFGEKTYAVQFHPEVYHTEYGSRILANFVKTICGCSGDWTPASFIDTTVDELHRKLGSDTVILGLSGGVDSTVAAVLLHKAIGERLHCIFVDNGLLRRNEFAEVMESYRGLGLNVSGVDASQRFLTALAGLTEPEAKRKAIGKTFIEVFEEEARRVDGARWLAQGTIYPDVIESAAVGGQAAKIKSHHNVGGLPEKMNLQIVEPLRMLFKDEVRRVGRALAIPASLIGRHPFPGPSLAIRVLGEVTFEKLEILRDADKVFIDALRADGLYDKIWQAGVILLPVKSVGVMGDERTYEYTAALRAVTSTDGMTADWYPLPYEFMARVSNDIIRHVRGINRVVYDISSKPPATIEWE
ncbi:MAG: glutamine-hydrolyzing GMP synthase [Bacteroidales bacterium]|nr:glutamine-hydrolyzing GMP synthase [Bacteroidales bacterium]